MWIRGHVEPVWDAAYKNFKFTKQPLTDEELIEWRSQGYTHSSFTGEMYSSKNPMPDWCDVVANQIGLSKTGFVIYRMVTDDIMPVHVDHYRRYCEVFDVDRSEVLRALVFLEDWKPGHYFEIDSTPIVNYTAGDYVFWNSRSLYFTNNRN